MQKTRITAVRYLNTRPLIEGLDRNDAIDLTAAAPSHIAEMVRNGDADIGLASIVDAVSGGVPLAVLPVGMIDNIAKPMIARQRLRLPGSVLFFAMLGGLATFGVMGVIAGPLIVSFFLVVVRALDAHAQSETGA